MKEELKKQLEERNERIIEAVIKKAQILCPGSIALIGVAGSFCTGDFHEKSDLDLCIVINDDKGWAVSSCFILGDIAHDIYCTPWKSMEEMAEYSDPYVTKLFDLDIVYCACEKDKNKYRELKEKVQSKLASSPNGNDLVIIRKHFDDALKEYADLMLEDRRGECKYASARMLRALEFVIYMVNKSYVKRGIRRIPEELAVMEALPEHFMRDHNLLVTAVTREEIRLRATAIMAGTKKFLEQREDKLSLRDEITPESLDGSYEEIYSNWRNKMFLASERNDPYLSLMTTAGCQELYDELSHEFNIKRIDLFNDFSISDLAKSAENFDTAMNEYKKLYSRFNKPVKSYSNIEEFEKDYLTV